MEEREILRRARMTNVLIGLVFLISIGFFFYGLINNIQANKYKEMAIKEALKQKECESKSQAAMEAMVIAQKQAILAQREAEKQRAMALESLSKAKRSK